MISFRLKEEKRCLHAHWSLQPTHFLKDWMPIFIVDPVYILDDQIINRTILGKGPFLRMVYS